MKKNDPMTIYKLINNGKSSDIKIVEGGSKRKVINIDSVYIESVSSELDKSEEYREYHVVLFIYKLQSYVYSGLCIKVIYTKYYETVLNCKFY